MAIVDTITEDGPHIIIYGDMWPDGQVCVKSGAHGWIPTEKIASGGRNPGGGGQGSGGDAPGETPTGDVGAMLKLWYDNVGKWSYRQDAGRTNPPESGYSDCSGCIWWAVNAVSPAIASGLGQWTGSMAHSGREIARGTRSTPFPADLAKPGDLLLIEWGYENYGFNDVSSHVEWIVGPDHIWGAGYGPLPHDSGSASATCASGRMGCWMIRRFMEG